MCRCVNLNCESPSSLPNVLHKTAAAALPDTLPISSTASTLFSRQNARAEAIPRIFASQPGWFLEIASIFKEKYLPAAEQFTQHVRTCFPFFEFQ
jgi:hypothetical protein